MELERFCVWVWGNKYIDHRLKEEEVPIDKSERGERHEKGTNSTVHDRIYTYSPVGGIEMKLDQWKVHQ